MICYIICLREIDAGDRMSTQETALSAASAAPLRRVATRGNGRAAGPLAWDAGRRVLLAAAACGALWAAVLWALS